MGLRSKDYDRCKLNQSVTIKLSDTDKKRVKQIANYPWFEKKGPWQKEIKGMLANDFKLEVESLISKDISYVTEEYVPQRLKDRDFLISRQSLNRRPSWHFSPRLTFRFLSS